MPGRSTGTTAFAASFQTLREAFDDFTWEPQEHRNRRLDQPEGQTDR